MSTQVRVGQQLERFSIDTIDGKTQSIPEPSHRFTHLQFRRFAGCPICNLHLRNFSRAAGELEKASICELVVFHSSVEEMRKYQGELPFAAAADPTKVLYRKFGVETSFFAPMHPRAMWASVRGMAVAKMGLRMENGPLGLPADILIDGAGTVIAAHYGTHAYDQWEVSDLLALAEGAGRLEAA